MASKAQDTSMLVGNVAIDTPSVKDSLSSEAFGTWNTREDDGQEGGG